MTAGTGPLPRPIPRDLAIDYLNALLRERVERARVPLPDAVVLNRAVDGPLRGLPAVCEDCGQVWRLAKTRPEERLPRGGDQPVQAPIRCAGCREDGRYKRPPGRRRKHRAWWQDWLHGHDPTATEPCLAHAVYGCQGEVRYGAFYCSDRCRKAVDRYLKGGGSIEAHRGGYAQRFSA